MSNLLNPLKKSRQVHKILEKHAGGVIVCNYAVMTSQEKSAENLRAWLFRRNHNVFDYIFSEGQIRASSIVAPSLRRSMSAVRQVYTASF